MNIFKQTIIYNIYYLKLRILIISIDERTLKNIIFLLVYYTYLLKFQN